MRAVGLLSRSPGTGTIVVDDVGASILGASFDVRDSFGCFELGEARKSVEGVCRVLGRPTPCVGREREVATLVGVADECFGDLVARAGDRHRSRRYRQVTIGERSAEVDPHPTARGHHCGRACKSDWRWDAVFACRGLLRQLGVGKTDDELFVDESSDGGASADPSGDPRGWPVCPPSLPIAMFLGPRGVSSCLRRLRSRRMGRYAPSSDRMEPLVLVIEDLQWGDLPSIALIDAALGRLGESQLFILATARPEVAATMPGIWARHPLQWIRLAPLSEVAAAQLVRSVVPMCPRRRSTPSSSERAAIPSSSRRSCVPSPAGYRPRRYPITSSRRRSFASRLSRKRIR